MATGDKRGVPRLPDRTVETSKNVAANLVGPVHGLAVCVTDWNLSRREHDALRTMDGASECADPTRRVVAHLCSCSRRMSRADTIETGSKSEL
jgi:hypothetical protein